MLGPFLTQLAEQFAPSAAARSIAIHVVASDRAALVDPILLSRAVGNLIANAVEHSSGTRVVVGVRRHGSGKALRIWVVDDGAGVSQADTRHIFDDYYRGTTLAGTATGGFGLGLSSARRIARLLGGEAGLDPRLRHGAAFYFDLPRPIGASANGSNLPSEFELTNA